jgi:methylase of polypeptide subunit release factors
MLMKNSKQFTSFCCDINPIAIEKSSETLRNNQIENFDAVQCNLMDPFINKLKVDVLLFNPVSFCV